jgi:hypothetical protein
MILLSGRLACEPDYSRAVMSVTAGSGLPTNRKNRNQPTRIGVVRKLQDAPRSDAAEMTADERLHVAPRDRNPLSRRFEQFRVGGFAEALGEDRYRRGAVAGAAVDVDRARQALGDPAERFDLVGAQSGGPDRQAAIGEACRFRMGPLRFRGDRQVRLSVPCAD